MRLCVRAQECTYTWTSVFAYACLRVCVCHVHGDVCVRVWSLHDSRCHNCAQKRLDILSGNHSRQSCVFLRHTNLTLSQRVTWLDPHIGSERGSPSSILSSIPISALHFTWIRSYRRSHSMSHFSVAKQRERTGWGWKWLVIGGQMSGQLTFSHRSVTITITVNVKFTDWSTGFV